MADLLDSIRNHFNPQSKETTTTPGSGGGGISEGVDRITKPLKAHRDSITEAYKQMQEYMGDGAAVAGGVKVDDGKKQDKVKIGGKTPVDLAPETKNVMPKDTKPVSTKKNNVIKKVTTNEGILGGVLRGAGNIAKVGLAVTGHTIMRNAGVNPKLAHAIGIAALSGFRGARHGRVRSSAPVASSSGNQHSEPTEITPSMARDISKRYNPRGEKNFHNLTTSEMGKYHSLAKHFGHKSNVGTAGHSFFSRTQGLASQIKDPPAAKKGMTGAEYKAAKKSLVDKNHPFYQTDHSKMQPRSDPQNRTPAPAAPAAAAPAASLASKMSNSFMGHFAKKVYAAARDINTSQAKQNNRFGQNTRFKPKNKSIKSAAPMAEDFLDKSLQTVLKIRNGLQKREGKN